jgi:hypothetical protein
MHRALADAAKNCDLWISLSLLYPTENLGLAFGQAKLFILFGRDRNVLLQKQYEATG